jgi:hypothetical protein
MVHPASARLFIASSEDQTETLWDVESRKRLESSFPSEEVAVPVAWFAPTAML